MKKSHFRRKSPVDMEDCGLVQAATLLGDKWVLLILREAFYGVVRFDDIRNEIGIPRAVLTNRLKRMVDAQVLKKHAYREPGSRTRYAYVLDEAGRQLLKVMMTTMQWGDRYLRKSESAIELKETKSGSEVSVKLVNQKGNEVALEDVTITVKQK